MAWPTERLQRALPDVRLQILPEVESTNTRLAEQFQQGETLPRLLVAERQSAGRGRQGRGWVSAPGASLTFSLARCLRPRDWSGLSLAVGAVLADAIEPQTSHPTPRLGLKWPNDLWLADGADGPWRKLGGILIETVTAGAERACVVGIGLNVQPLACAADLDTGHACVQELDPGWRPDTLLERVAPPLVAALEQFERDGFGAFAQAFARRDLLRGRPVVTRGGTTIEGLAEGVDAQGRLLLRTASGLLRVSSGEVGVRPRQAVD